MEAVLFEDGEGGVGCVTFGDAAEVDEEVGGGFGEGACGGVEFEGAPVGEGEGFGGLLRGGEFVLAFGAAPVLGGVSDGDIECAVGEFGDFVDAGEDLVEVVAEREGLLMRGAVDMAEFAMWEVIRGDEVDLVDAGDGGLEGGFSECGVAGVEVQMEQRAHARVLPLIVFWRCCGGGLGERK